MPTRVIPTMLALLTLIAGAAAVHAVSPAYMAGAGVRPMHAAGSPTTQRPWQVVAPARSPALYTPMGIALGASGFVYVADMGADSVVKLSPTGQVLARWGSAGSGPGQFQSPTGVAVDRNGSVYVADAGNERIEKFARTGRFLTSWSVLSSASDVPMNRLEVAVGSRGNVFVFRSDGKQLLLQRYSPTGALLSRWGITIRSHIDLSFTSECPSGTCQGDISGYDPLAVTVGPFGTIYLSIRVDLELGKDTGQANFIQKLSPGGKWLREWGMGQKNQGPEGLAVDRGNVVVADTDNHRVLTFSPTGRRLASWGAAGCAPRRFGQPVAVAVAGPGNVFVVDATNQNVQKLTAQGHALALWGGCPGSGFSFPLDVAADSHGDLLVADTEHARIVRLSAVGRTLAVWGSHGTGPGQFAWPMGVALDAQDNLYVVDTRNNRMQKLSPTGAVLAVWGSLGAKPGQFNGPMGAALDAQGNVYVADTWNNRIQKLSPTGAPLAHWGSEGNGPGQFEKPEYLALDAQGNVYVTDTGNSRIQKLSPTGKPLAVWQLPATSQWTGPPSPDGIAVDRNGNIYVTAEDNVFELSPHGTVIAHWGTPESDFSLSACVPRRCLRGPGQFYAPAGIAIDAQGAVYVADSGYSRIQKLPA